MMGLETMRYLNQESASKAAEARLEPAQYEELQGGMNFARLVPNLGYFIPEGFSLIRALFVDKTGMGEMGEMAATVDEFVDALVDERFYAIIEEGQFQVHIGEFVRSGDEPAVVDLSPHWASPPDDFIAEAARAAKEAG